MQYINFLITGKGQFSNDMKIHFTCGQLFGTYK